MAKLATRFDVEALQEFAGEKVFARGEAYFRDGAVTIRRQSDEEVRAIVAGTENYQTELSGSGRDIDGECSCPAFEDWGFCKHMVAVALAVNAKAPVANEDSLGRIRRHLTQQKSADLVALIVELAENDDSLMQRLELASLAVGGDAKALEKRLRQAIDAATAAGRFIDYRAAPGWARKVEAALDALAPLATGKSAEVARRLALHALARIEAASGSMDDSDGHCGALIQSAQDIHVAACKAIKPEPKAFARELLDCILADPNGVFHDAVVDYSEVLGDAGRSELFRLAMAKWEKLPRRAPKRRYDDTSEASYDRLFAILDALAGLKSDDDLRIALRAKTLGSAWDYFQLADFCQRAGRASEALSWAEEGVWTFEDERPDTRLVDLTVGLMKKAGRKADAVQLLDRVFRKDPHLETYNKLRALGGAGGCVAFLEAQSAQKPRPGLAGTLIRIHMQERRYAEAWAAVDAHRADDLLQEALADASRAAFPDRALAVYKSRVEAMVSWGGNREYEESAKLVRVMSSLQGPAEQQAYIAGFKERHRRRRNFMKLIG